MEKTAIKNQAITEVSKVMASNKYYQDADHRQNAILWAIENLDNENLNRLEAARKIKNKYKSEQFKSLSAQKTADRKDLQAVISTQFEAGSLDSHIINLFNMGFNSEKIRMITFAYIFKGLSQPEIAKEYGLTIDQVRYGLQKGSKICKNNLELLAYIRFKIDREQCIRYRKSLKSQDKTPVYPGIHYDKSQIKAVVKTMQKEQIAWNRKKAEKKQRDMAYLNRLDKNAVMFATRDKFAAAAA